MLARLLVSALALTQAVFAAPIVKRQQFSGDATYYAVGGEIGAHGSCGELHFEGEMVVALNAPMYNLGMCGKRVTITANGKTASATVVDLCPGCSYGALDMSEKLFNVFNPSGVGRFQMSWVWSDGSAGGGGGEVEQTKTKEEPAPAPTSAYTPPPYTPPATSEYTPPPTSEYVAPTSTYTPPTSTAQSTTVSTVAPSASTTSIAVPSELASSYAASVSASVSASVAASVSASAGNLNATSTGSASTLKVSTAASAPLPVDSLAAGEDDGGNLAALNQLMASFGRIVTVSSQQ